MQHYVLILVCIVTSIFHASGQNLAELERRNGFKSIKLGMHIDSVAGDIKFRKDLLEQDEFPARVFEVSAPSLMSIGEVNVRKIEVKTYNDRIYHIQVLTDKDSRLMRALESIYGPSVYDMKNQSYFWKGDTLILKFSAHGRNQLELLFTSYVILQQMKADKERKVEAIADDF